MRTHRFLGLLLVLAVLVVSGPTTPASALPGADISTPAQAGTAVEVAAAPAGNVHTAASCSQEHVQAAVDAASDGDFVLVPAGNCTWTTPVDYTPAVWIVGKAITLQGAGIGQTVITDNTGTLWRQTPIWVDGVEGHPFRITGFTFTGQPSAAGIIAITGTCKNFRIDHCQFDGVNGRSIGVNGHSYGVIDHCEFIHSGGQGVWVADPRGDPPGSTSWEEPMSYGTADAVYIEDSTFIWSTGSDSAVDCTTGGRYTFRYNTVEGMLVGNHGMDSAPRSCLQMEIYENTFRPASHTVFLAIQSRGGSAIAFNNTINGNYGSAIGVTNYRSCCYAGAACSSHGQCDGTNPLDGNTEPRATYKGWPCRDQIGRGTQQTSHPFYEWNNTYNGSDVDVTVYCGWPTCIDPHPSDHVQENRDYYDDTPKPGYTPYIYPHPLTKDLVLTGLPAAEVIYLDWSVASWTYLPPTTTWRIDYVGTPGDQVSPITGIVSPTRAYTLTGLANYEWYTITLSAMLDVTSFLSDTVRVMPTDRLLYLPLVMSER